MARRPPRYDLPNAAPEPLRLVQRFVNTVNLERGDDWLADWLGDQGLAPTPRELESAREVREALRELLHANNRQPSEGDPARTLNAAAVQAGLRVDFGRGELVPEATGVSALVGQVLAVAFRAMGDGTWSRLKACRNHGCRWAFYDESRNRSAQWCSMQLCGNRTKTRSYRARHGRA